MNRLTGTMQKQKSGTTWDNLTASYLEKGITYDRNGNIKTMQRTAGGTLVAVSYTHLDLYLCMGLFMMG